jgi:predicted Fe-Mo cluster-binding NifX family protein
MGPGGLTSFQNAGVTVLKATEETVKGIVNSFNEDTLEELMGSCEHAHEHHHSHNEHALEHHHSH